MGWYKTLHFRSLSDGNGQFPGEQSFNDWYATSGLLEVLEIYVVMIYDILIYLGILDDR